MGVVFPAPIHGSRQDLRRDPSAKRPAASLPARARAVTCSRMDIVHPEPPVGQQFIVRGHLRQVLARAPFEGDAWNACVAAFLLAPGHPLLAQSGTTQAPASFFLDLYATREPTYPPEGEGRWGEAELRW